MSSKKILINLSTATFCLIAFLISHKAGASLGGFRSADDDQAKNIEQRRTLGSGTRSQCEVTFPPNSITLLVPDTQVVHETANSQPSFYVETTVASKTPLNFTLVDPKVSKPVAENSITVSKPGTKKIELPNQTKLEPNKIYLWYLGIPCRDSSEYQEILTSSVKFVPASTMVLNKLQSTTGISKIMRIYAENGYWYDALDLSIRNGKSSLKQLQQCELGQACEL